MPPFINYSTTKDSSGHTKILGRGSNDAKASIASQIVALTSLLSRGTISESGAALLFVCGEETSGVGMKTFSQIAEAQNRSWESVIFGEPTELKLARGHKGIMYFDVHARGKAAHSGYPWLGESAVEMLLPAVTELRNLETSGALEGSERYGNTTINIGTFTGGEARNVVPAHAKLEVAIRLGGGTKQLVTDTVKELLGWVDERLEVDIGTGGYAPVECDTDIEGFETIGVNYGTDVPNLKGDHKRYLYGPGSILTAHSDNEFVLASDLVEAVEGYRKLVLGALKKGKRELS